MKKTTINKVCDWTKVLRCCLCSCPAFLSFFFTQLAGFCSLHILFTLAIYKVSWDWMFSPFRPVISLTGAKCCWGSSWLSCFEDFCGGPYTVVGRESWSLQTYSVGHSRKCRYLWVGLDNQGWINQNLLPSTLLFHSYGKRKKSGPETWPEVITSSPALSVVRALERCCLATVQDCYRTAATIILCLFSEIVNKF